MEPKGSWTGSYCLALWIWQFHLTRNLSTPWLLHEYVYEWNPYPFLQKIIWRHSWWFCYPGSFNKPDWRRQRSSKSYIKLQSLPHTEQTPSSLWIPIGKCSLLVSIAGTIWKYIHKHMYTPCEKKAEFANVTESGMFSCHRCLKRFRWSL
jgi:hypothetical protein